MKLHDIIIYESRGETITAIHFSKKSNLTMIDASRHGSGIIGAERKRARDYPEYYNKKRVYFYKKDSNFRKEGGLGNNEYIAVLKNIYDMNKDKDKLKKEAILKSKKELGMEDSPTHDPNLAATFFENLIKERGYSGYWESKSNIIIYFKSVDVTPIE